MPPLRFVALWILAVPGLWGCRDADGDPLAVVLAEESGAALAFSETLPRLPELLGRAGLGDPLAGPLQRWESSWALPPHHGRAERAAAYLGVAEPLAEALSSHELEEAFARFDSVLAAAARSAGAGVTPPRLTAQLGEARALGARGAEALADGRGELAVRSLLEASDALRELGPRQVAHTLVVRAEEGLRRSGSGAAYSLQEEERLERLVRGARDALDRSDYVRAIRRAFYACQLLGPQALEVW